MARPSKHFLRKSKRVAKKTLRHKTSKCKRHCTRRHYRSQRGGELLSDPTFSQAIVPIKTEEGISIFRTADQAKELLNVGQQESYVEEVPPVQNNNTNANKKKLNQNLSQNKYNNRPVENAES